jgi:hypothetical protein
VSVVGSDVYIYPTPAGVGVTSVQSGLILYKINRVDCLHILYTINNMIAKPILLETRFNVFFLVIDVLVNS